MPSPQAQAGLHFCVAVAADAVAEANADATLAGDAEADLKLTVYGYMVAGDCC